MFEITPFGGRPIVKLKSDYNFSDTEKKFLSSQEYKNNNNGTKLTKRVDILENPNLYNLKNYLLKIANDYVSDVLSINQEILLTHSWMTKNSTNNFHDKHTHPNVFFSLIYYLDCKSGDLIFYNQKSAIQQAFNFDFQIKKYNLFNSPTCTVRTRTDDIIIFPGDMIHGTSPNEGKDDRIVLALNFFVKGVFGVNDNYLKINL